MTALSTTLLATPIADPGFSRSKYHMTLEQLRFFDENGYVILRNLISDDLLAKLQAAGDGWIQQGLELTSEDEDYRFKNEEDKRIFFRVDYLHDKGFPVSLELLGSPQILGVAESMVGVNFVPTYEAMVFKQEGDGVAIRWHQDAIHPRQWRIFNLDLYLDPSHKGAGALYVIPGTQSTRQAFCNIENSFGWDYPGAIEVEMEPGDVLLHDVMVAHGSPETHGKPLRRTIYYEFRAAEEILADGPWDRQWIDRRLRLIPLALSRFSQAYPQSEQFTWKISPEFRPKVTEDETLELKVAHIWHMPGSTCSAGDTTKV
jgi:ectoine hydroxylase-related dioxygenase (phytanoyl-CoA dioxygenase family)